MRIVYVLTTLAVGGTERQVLAIAGRMAARGNTVAILVLKPRGTDDCTTAPHVIHLDIHRSVPGLIRGLRRGVAFLRAFRPDVVHSHNFHGNMMARIMRLFYRDAKLISTIHNVYEGGGLRMLAYRATDRLVDRTTAVSAVVAERFARSKAVGRDNCLVVTNGIEVSDFVPDPERRSATRAEMGVRDEFVWITVGRLVKAKDYPNLLRAFALVASQDKKSRLWVAGGGADEDIAALETECHELSTRRAARWIGMRRDIPALLDAADGFVLASAWEGMPLAVGEAMAMEKPVVATDVGGVRELVGDAGVLVPAKKANALAGAMLDLMRFSNDQRGAMGRAARMRILEKFDMDAKANEWEELYRSTVDHNRPKASVLP